MSYEFDRRPIAVVGEGTTLTAALLRRLTRYPVTELTPCRAAMGVDGGQRYRAVIVENFDREGRRGLSPCAAARWELARRSDVTVVGLDDGEGRRMAECMPVFTYSDGCSRADLAAKQVRLRGETLEFEALTDRELLRVRVPILHGPRLYDYLAALAGALAVGVPLERAACRLQEI